jgi:hypothetical protein
MKKERHTYSEQAEGLNPISSDIHYLLEASAMLFIDLTSVSLNSSSV